MSSINYRPEIDGLRAISVISVLLFHAELCCPGGFVGVDVFFVISGFLITSLILKDLDGGTFTFSGFWERRVRRILPASLFVTLAVMAFGYLVLVPSELVKVYESAIGHLSFLSNVFFYMKKNSGYFSEASHLQPLLHMWSLAIEEQFYIVFPIALFLLRRVARRTLFWMMLVVAIVSLVASAVFAFTWPKFAFFLLPTRAWELLAGSLPAIYPRSSNRPFSQPVANGLAILGLSGIAIPIFLYHETMSFPGLAAIPPCLGCALIIIANTHQETLVGKLLSGKVLGFVGAISFSLYLWHWPVFSYYRIFFGRQMSSMVACLLLIVCLIAGTLSWRFIETPFRKRQITGERVHLFSLMGGVSLALLMFSFWMIRNEGFPGRFDKALIQDITYRGEDYSTINAAFDVRNMRKFGETAEGCDVMFWGDSHGMMVAEAVDESAKRHGLSGRVSVQYAMVPVPGIWIEDRESTLRRNASIMEYIESHGIKHVLLVSRWSAYTDGFTVPDADDNGNPDLYGCLAKQSSDDVSAPTPTIDRATITIETGLESLASALQNLNVKLYILQQIPEQKVTRVSSQWLRSKMLGMPRFFDYAIPSLTHAEYIERNGKANEILNRLAIRFSNVTLLETESLFFPDPSRNLAIVSKDGHCLYRDNDHTSAFGSRLLVSKAIDPVFANIVRDKVSGGTN